MDQNLSEVNNGAVSYARRSAERKAARSHEARAFAEQLRTELQFERRLREFRETFGLTQKQVAAIIGENQGDVSRLENGRLNPTNERMGRITGRIAAYVEQNAPTPQLAPIVDDPLTTASQAAKYLRAVRDEEDGFGAMKLQKLLYYGQGICLAVLRRPLFGEPIKAWAHGPVVPSVRGEYKRDESLINARPADLEMSTVDPDVRAILDRVYRDYGQFEGWALREKTHEERPWKETFSEEDNNREISRELIAEFFTAELASEAAR